MKIYGLPHHDELMSLGYNGILPGAKKHHAPCFAKCRKDSVIDMALSVGIAIATSFLTPMPIGRTIWNGLLVHRVSINLQPLHLIYSVRPSSHHGKPVKTEGDPGAGWHAMRQCRQEVFIERPIGAVQSMAPRAITMKSRPLFIGIGQLNKRVGKFNPTDIKLEPLANESGMSGAAVQATAPRVPAEGEKTNPPSLRYLAT